MRRSLVAGLAALVLAGASHAAAAAPMRILSLDQCADQHALALAPDADLYLSPRADDPDAWLRSAASGRPRVRATLESALVLKPDVVIRSWGGDARLLRALALRDVRVIQIEDAADLDDVRRNTLAVAEALGREEAGRRLVARMDAKLDRARLVPNAEPDPSALYLTAGGFTAGRGTLIDAILRAAGYSNAAGFSGFGPMSVERLVLSPPTRFVLGFFDQARADWRGVGRHPLVRRMTRQRSVADLPASVLTCPAWFAADAVQMVGEGRTP